MEKCQFCQSDKWQPLEKCEFCKEIQCQSCLGMPFGGHRVCRDCGHILRNFLCRMHLGDEEFEILKEVQEDPHFWYNG